MKGCSPSQCAEREAVEEAGVFGPISDAPLGSYRYKKIRRSGRHATCQVPVFPLYVAHEGKNWREKAQRKRRWLLPMEAARRVNERGLKHLIMRFASSSHRI